jgi:hypothetical protein
MKKICWQGARQVTLRREPSDDTADAESARAFSRIDGYIWNFRPPIDRRLATCYHARLQSMGRLCAADTTPSSNSGFPKSRLQSPPRITLQCAEGAPFNFRFPPKPCNRHVRSTAPAARPTCARILKQLFREGNWQTLDGVHRRTHWQRRELGRVHSQSAEVLEIRSEVVQRGDRETTLRGQLICFP